MEVNKRTNEKNEGIINMFLQSNPTIKMRDHKYNDIQKEVEITVINIITKNISKERVRTFGNKSFSININQRTENDKKKKTGRKVIKDVTGRGQELKQ